MNLSLLFFFLLVLLLFLQKRGRPEAGLLLLLLPRGGQFRVGSLRGVALALGKCAISICLLTIEGMITWKRYPNSEKVQL